MSQEKNSERSFDLRTLDAQLRRGDITQKEYDQFLNSLPNDEGNYDEAVIQDDPEESWEEDDLEEEEEEEEEELGDL
jgi:hypothetical protein